LVLGASAAERIGHPQRCSLYEPTLTAYPFRILAVIDRDWMSQFAVSFVADNFPKNISFTWVEWSDVVMKSSGCELPPTASDETVRLSTH
jgi:hypothetical protein